MNLTGIFNFHTWKMRFWINFLRFFVTIWGFSLNNFKTSVIFVNWVLARWRALKYLSKSYKITIVSIIIWAWKTRLKHIKALRTAAPRRRSWRGEAAHGDTDHGGRKALWREGSQCVPWETSIIDTWYRQINVFCKENSNSLRCLHVLLYFCSLRDAYPISVYASLVRVLFWVLRHICTTAYIPSLASCEVLI